MREQVIFYVFKPAGPNGRALELGENNTMSACMDCGGSECICRLIREMDTLTRLRQPRRLQIDPRFETDGVQIIKTSNREAIPANEPTMLFRARDRHALAMLRYYRELCAADGCTDYQMAGIDERILAFGRFTIEHPERMKQPGITRGK